MASSKTDFKHFIERHSGGERAVLVQVHLDDVAVDLQENVEEFKALCLSAGLEIIELFQSKKHQPEVKYFVGSGKAQQIQDAVVACSAQVVVFNHSLTPGQARNLEAFLGCRVIDRQELILDIFAQRAKTHEGKLQVELAQLKHISTRLVRGWTHLERQKGGIGLRGPGETQLETDRRLVAQRIKKIEKALDKVLKQREQNRRARLRADIPVVSLVGYTNAGKSTLFNQMTQANVYAADQLFATLDPTHRLLQYYHSPKSRFMIVDTVGFIRDLPHDLIAAFRATLESTKNADLVLHVVDAHHPNHQEWMQTVEQVLMEIGAEKVPCLIVYNKIDLIQEEARIDRNDWGEVVRVWISAATGLGLELLFQAVLEKLGFRLRRDHLTVASQEYAVRQAIYQKYRVLSESTDEEGCYHLEVEWDETEYRIFKHAQPAVIIA